MRALLASTMLLIASPALAQETTSPADAPSSAQPAGTESVSAIVDSEFPAYDSNGDDLLDQAEFSRWMVALKNQEIKTTGKTLTPPEVTAWANGAFVTADSDKSATITKAELIAYLSAGAR